ncbi:MAG: hypothetical protein M1832_005103 [Thelocarpon impressellum]|nr:MAG: hypothetical protein M1832_005103 [Thelocarpon impressellum]
MSPDVHVIQPTQFWLHTLTLQSVFDTPSLISSLAVFSELRQPSSLDSPILDHGHDTSSSVLFLQLQAAADYFTTNGTLMLNVPPVDVEIILDPFLLNVLPRSLGPTAIYIIVLAAGSYFLSGLIWSWLQALGQQPAAPSLSSKKKST